MFNELKSKANKSPSRGLLLAIFSTGVLLSSWQVASAQAPSVQDALEDRRRLAEAQTSIDASGGEAASKFSLESARMYNQLLSFRYTPSQRDPFISSIVVSPFVTEDEAPLELPADMEQVQQARKIIMEVVRRRIDISGVAYGKVGSSYTIAYSDQERMVPQILRPGDYIVIDMSPDEQTAVDDAYKLAAAAGVKLNLKVANNRPALMLRVLAIDGNTMEVENPGDEGSFTVSYKKQLEVDNKPKPANVE
jgi:hypothetical protein